MEIKKHYYNWQDIENMCVNIVKQMYKDNFYPDYILGLTRGGNIPATIISNMLDIRCEAMKVSFRNDDRVEKNHWLSTLDKKILIVDDINDTGATFNWIWEDWNLSKKAHKVKFAVLTDNMGSKFEEVNYSVHEVNKTEKDVWLVYPWENVGDYQ
tara:strand:- start:370 stop:834 length:465 start_codon:yes stop_codon:yes gene_type:complete